MGAAAVGFGGQWLERAIRAGSLHKALYVKAGVRGAEKAQGLQWFWEGRTRDVDKIIKFLKRGGWDVVG
jgi:hypothetical protein